MQGTVEATADQTQKPEGTAGEVAAQTTEQPEKLSPQFAALARKEKALRAEAQKIKSEREAWLKERDTEKLKYETDYVSKDRIKKESILVLKEQGFTDNQIAEMLLNGQPASAEDPRVAKLMSRIEELEGSVETKFKEKETKEREQALNDIRNEAKILIDSNPDFETIKATGKLEAVVEHIKRTYDEDGIALSTEEAAQEVEEALLEEAMKMAGLNKVKQRLNPIPPVAPVEEKKQQQISLRQSQPIKTLTHDMVSSSQAKNLSAKARYERAVLRAQGIDPDTGKPIAG